tara:strand:+ start:2895 stop:4040 length:1146 start_codon:yes stop_codon:yes gene_type:complete
MAKKFDSIVIGGGLVGSLASLVLSSHSESVCLIEKNKFNNLTTDSYSPLSLTLNSVQFLKGHNLWDEKYFKCRSINNLKIKLFNNLNTVSLSSKDINLISLGSVIEKASFLSYLRDLCNKNSNITVIDEVDVEFDNPLDPTKILNPISSVQYDYDKLIITDGANSKFARELKIGSTHIDYKQTSYIFNAKYESSTDTAYQIFSKRGVFAILPGSEKHRSIVATIHNKYIDDFKFESNEMNIDLLEKELQPNLKSIDNLKLIYSHPLNTTRLDTWTIKNIMFLGNSSQLLHPFGAQGFNFALNCIKTINSHAPKLLLNGELCPNLKHLIQKQRETLFKSIDLTSLALMKNDIVSNLTSSLFAKSLNISQTIKRKFLKKILNL